MTLIQTLFFVVSKSNSCYITDIESDIILYGLKLSQKVLETTTVLTLVLSHSPQQSLFSEMAKWGIKMKGSLFYP